MFKVIMEVRRLSLTATEKAGWMRALDPEGEYPVEEFADDNPELLLRYTGPDYEAVRASVTLHDRMNPANRVMPHVAAILPKLEPEEQVVHEALVPPDSLLFSASAWTLVNITPTLQHAKEQLEDHFGAFGSEVRIERDVIPSLAHMAGILNQYDEALRPVIQ